MKPSNIFENIEDWFVNEAIPKNINHIYIEANGGFGKSTSLKHLCKTLANRYEDYKIIPIYIDVKVLTTVGTIPRFILQEYCGDPSANEPENTSREDLVIRQLRNKNYKYAIVIDGLNEVDSSVVYRNVIEFINDAIQSFENVFIILSSRTPIKKFKELGKLTDFVCIRYWEFDKEKIKALISDRIPDPSKAVLYVFSRPMMMSIYMNTANKEKYKDIENEAQVLNIFFSEQWQITSNWRKGKNYEENYSLFIKFVILEFLPNLCKFGDSIFQVEDIKYALEKTDYENSCFRFVYQKNQFDEIENLNAKEIRKFLRDDLQIADFYNDNYYFSIHQTFASYFQAKYFDLALDAWLKDTSKKPEFLLVQNYPFFGNNKYSEYKKMFLKYHNRNIFNNLRLYENIMFTFKFYYFNKAVDAIFSLFALPKYDKEEFIKFKNILDERLSWIEEDLSIDYSQYIEILHVAFERLFPFSDFKKNNVYRLDSSFTAEEIDEYYQYEYFEFFLKKMNHNINYTAPPPFSLNELNISPAPDGCSIILYHLSKDSIAFINQLSAEKYIKLIKHLQAKTATKNITLIDSENIKDNKFEPLYSLYLELISLLLKCNSNARNIDLSDLDLTPVNLLSLINSKFNLGDVSISLQNSKLNLTVKGYYAVPCIHSDEIRLLWYKDDYICISYPYRKEIVFIFDNTASVIANSTNNYFFGLETNRTGFYGYNFLYIPKGNRELHCYNFILRIDMPLFQLSSDIKVSDIKLLSWYNGCNYIRLVHGNTEIFFDLKGNVVKQNTAPQKLADLDPEKLYALRKSHDGEDIIEDIIKEKHGEGYSLKIHIRTNFSDNDYVIGKIGDSNFKMSQYQFDDGGVSVLVAKQFSNTAKLSEYSCIGEKLRDIEFDGTLINKCFFDNTSFYFYGFDNNLYYVNSKNVTSRYDFGENALVGVISYLKLMVLTLDSHVTFYKIEEDNFRFIKEISYEDIFKSVGINDNVISKQIFSGYNSLVLTIELQNDSSKTEYKFLKLNPDLSFTIYNSCEIKKTNKYIVSIDTFHNNLNFVNRNVLDTIAHIFKDCDNFDFYNIHNYNFYLFENDTLIVSSPSLNSTLIIDVKSLQVQKNYNNAVIYNAYSNWVIINSNIEPKTESDILSYFKNSKAVKVDQFIRALNLKSCTFSKKGFSPQTIKELRQNGATVV